MKHELLVAAETTGRVALIIATITVGIFLFAIVPAWLVTKLALILGMFS